MFMPEVYEELATLSETLTEEQEADKQKFIAHFEHMGGLFGCPTLWIMYEQAWFLYKGFKLEHCSYKTAEGLLGITAKNLTKLHEHLKE